MREKRSLTKKSANLPRADCQWQIAERTGANPVVRRPHLAIMLGTPLAPPGSMIGRNLTELNNDASPALGCPGVATPHSLLESVQGGRRALCCALSGRPTIHPFSSLQFCMCHVRWDFTCRDAVCHMTPHTARVPSVACLHVPTMQIVRELR